MNFKVLDCTTTYGGLDTNISISYICIDDYKVYKLIMNLDSVQEEMIKTSKDPNGIISGIIDKFHKHSRTIYIDEMSDELVTKLRDFKLYEILR